MIYHNKIKRIVTDPTTGEVTQVVTTDRFGRVEWRVSRELREDGERAIEKSKTIERVMNVFRRAIS